MSKVTPYNLELQPLPPQQIGTSSHASSSVDMDGIQFGESAEPDLTEDEDVKQLLKSMPSRFSRDHRSFRRARMTSSNPELDHQLSRESDAPYRRPPLFRHRIKSDDMAPTSPERMTGVGANQYSHLKEQLMQSETGKEMRLNLSRIWYLVSLRFIWSAFIKMLEAKYGFGVGSLFRLVRWLCQLNLLMALVVIAFLMTPRLILRKYSDFFLVDKLSSMWDVVTGAGWFTNSELYYGFYIPTDNSSLVAHNKDISFNYDMTKAYFWVTVFTLFSYTVFVGRKIIRSYSGNFLESSEEFFHGYAAKMLSLWDFSIRSKQSSSVKQRAVYYELQELQIKLRKKRRTGRYQWLRNILVHLTVELACIAIIASAAFAVHITSTIFYFKETEKSSISDSFVVPLVMSFVVIVLPFFLDIIASFGGYDDAIVNVNLSIFRLFILKFLMLGTLLLNWMNVVGCLQQSEKQATKYAFCYTFMLHVNTTASIPENSIKRTCWETWIGQEIFKLMWIDTAVYLVICLARILIKNGLNRIAKGIFNPADVNIAQAILHVVYTQTICWIGIYFLPLISIITFLKLMLFFFVLTVFNMLLCQPSTRLWHGMRTYTIPFVFLLCASLVAEITTVAFIVMFKPSQTCGPFSNVEKAFDVVFIFWELFTDVLVKGEAKSTAISTVFFILKSSGLVFFIVAILVVLCFRLRHISMGKDKVIYQYKKNIELESRDKVYLLKKLREARMLNPSSAHPKSPLQTTKSVRKMLLRDFGVTVV